MNLSRCWTIAMPLAVAVAWAFGPPQDAPPVCDAGNVQWVEANGAVSTCPLDASASYDPERSPLTYYWEDANTFTWFDDPTSPTPTLFVDMGSSCVLEAGAILLRVTDAGGRSSTCTTAVVFQDTTPPELVRPDDVIVDWNGGWPFQTSPSETGMATALDARDPEVLVYYRDVVMPGHPPTGIEQIVERTWFAQDMCDQVVSDMQTIWIVGPSFYEQFAMDVMLGSCPNEVSTRRHGTLDVTLFGAQDFFAGSVLDVGLCRVGGDGAICRPVWGQVVDAGCPVAGSSCGSTVPDGYADLVLTFDIDELFAAMGLKAVGDTTTVMLQLQGTDQDGQPFAARDSIVLIDLQARQVPFRATHDQAAVVF